MPDETPSRPLPSADQPQIADAVFSGSRFIGLAVGPLSLFAGASLLRTVQGTWGGEDAMRLLVGAIGCLFGLAVLFPRRCGFLARGVTLLVFVLCAWYVVMEWHRPQPANGTPGDHTLANAIRAMLAFGLPALWFALRRRPGSGASGGEHGT
ncbi:MAG: hypothetical protein U1E73_00675 [Planctomycetota bacterium]